MNTQALGKGLHQHNVCQIDAQKFRVKYTASDSTSAAFLDDDKLNVQHQQQQQQLRCPPESEVCVRKNIINFKNVKVSVCTFTYTFTFSLSFLPYDNTRFKLRKKRKEVRRKIYCSAVKLEKQGTTSRKKERFAIRNLFKLKTE